MARPARTTVGAVLAALLYACAGLPRAAPAPMPAAFLAASAVPTGPCAAGPAPTKIGVSIEGWHSGIILPAEALGPLRQLFSAFPDARYLSFGWGNRRFYMATHPGPTDALAALFRSQSVLLVQGASRAAALDDGSLYWVCADRAQLWRLDAYLGDALRRRDGLPIDLGPGLLPDSRFYAATGHYDALHTCNTWTLAALEYAGLPVHASGVIFAAQLPHRLRRLRRCPLDGH